MQSEEREMENEKMSTQKLAPKKPQIGKWMLIAAIVASSLALLLLLLGTFRGFCLLGWPPAHGAAILSFLLSFAAAILYLTREEQAAAARAWGILGGFVLVPFGWMAFPVFFMAIGGGALALRRPKLAGVLMLVGAIIGVVGFLLIASMLMHFGEGVSLLEVCVIVMPPLLATSFLIPGGILALTSRAGQRASKKMVTRAIAALFVLSLWPVLYYLIIYLLFW